MKAEAKIKEIKLGFLGWFMHMPEQPCVRIIKLAYATLIVCTWVSTQKS